VRASARLVDRTRRSSLRDMVRVFVNGTTAAAVARLPLCRMGWAAAAHGVVAPRGDRVGSGLVGSDGWCHGRRRRRSRRRVLDLPLDRGVVYTASALGTALVAYAAVDWLAPVSRRHHPLRRAGQIPCRSTSRTSSSSTWSSTGSGGSTGGRRGGIVVRLGLLDRRDRPRGCMAAPIRHGTRRADLSHHRRMTRHRDDRAARRRPRQPTARRR